MCGTSLILRDKREGSILHCQIGADKLPPRSQETYSKILVAEPFTILANGLHVGFNFSHNYFQFELCKKLNIVMDCNDAKISSSMTYINSTIIIVTEFTLQQVSQLFATIKILIVCRSLTRPTEKFHRQQFVKAAGQSCLKECYGPPHVSVLLHLCSNITMHNDRETS